MNADPRARARRPVAVLLSRFPSVTETFILREGIEMERQGQPVRLVPLLRESPPVVHPEARPWVERALYTPFLSRAIVASNVRALLHRPGRYLWLLLRLVAASLGSPRFLAATLAIVPKSVHLARCLDDEGIRHVHAHFGSHPATAAFVIASFTDATFSVTVHAHDLFMRRYRPFLGTKLRAAAFVRVISAFNRRELRARYRSVPPENVRVVHVGVDPEAYATRAQDSAPKGPGPKPEIDPPAGTARILSVAGLRAYKGPGVLVEACRRLRDAAVPFHCEFVGEGPLRRDLERQIVEAGLEGRVRLAGAETQGAVAERLRAHPIVVHPSVVLGDGMRDGIPVALMEAMAAGAPVVASRVSGIPELVEDGVNGLLVEPEDAGALAAAIRRLAE
ncbi:MAG: glycosyltransferase, partial [Gemmatimonadetes bacterium]|nr:glycosyltransferase [Gemmatimonadota bacterium]